MSLLQRLFRRLVRRTSLRVTLVVAVVLPLALALGISSYAVLSAFERFTEERMEEDVELVARSIRMPLSRALQQDRPGAVEEALRSAFSINRVYGAYVYDNQGNIISAIASADLAPDRSRLSELAEEGAQRGEYERISGRAVYSYFVPLSTRGGRNAGLLQVVRRARDINQAVAFLRWTAFGVFLTTVVLMTGLVLWGHRVAIGGPLERLRKDMTRIEEGSRSHRTTPQGPVEIAALGRQFNTMVQSIEQAEAEIREREAEQRKLEQQLKRAEKMAAIGQLSAGVAHELGTPLSVVDGKAQRALRQEELSPAVVDALEEVRSEVRRMEHIVRQLLDFGRRNPLQRRTVSAERIVQMALSSIRAEIPEVDSLLEIDSRDASSSFSVDPGLLERVLVNLLRNAVDADPEGIVRLTWRETDTDVVFTVEDSGPGIDPELKSRIFEPFFTTKSVGEGTGLGLAVVHGIVEEHGGHVAVQESELGGACFQITIPQRPPSDSPDFPPSSPSGTSLRNEV